MTPPKPTSFNPNATQEWLVWATNGEAQAYLTQLFPLGYAVHVLSATEPPLLRESRVFDTRAAAAAFFTTNTQSRASAVLHP